MYRALQHESGKKCALCEAHAKAAERHRTARPAKRERLVPWIVVLAASAVVAGLLGDAGRWVALGVVLGTAAGAGIAWLNYQTSRHFAAATLASATEELKAEADQRVGMVIRQFEWAVNDVANLRDALKHAQEGRAVAEASEQRVRRRLHMIERHLFDAQLKIGEYSRALGGAEHPLDVPVAPVPATTTANADDELVVPLSWKAYEENLLTWLRFDSAGIIPAQVRILNEHDSVIAISSRALERVAQGRQTFLILRAPDEVIASLQGRDQGAFKFEALVDETWCRVELRPATNAAAQRTQRRTRDDNHSQALIA